MSGTEEVPGWLATVLDRMPVPEAPVGQPWDFSAAAVLTPRLPPGTRWLAGKLDRLGAVRVSLQSIIIDSVGPIRWTDLSEVRTCPPLDAVTDAAKETITASLSRLVPFGRGPAQRVLGDAADVVLGLLRRARCEGSGAAVPFEFGYRRRRRNETVTPGVVASAVLSLPQVAASVLKTARLHGVAVTRQEGSTS